MFAALSLVTHASPAANTGSQHTGGRTGSAVAQQSWPLFKRCQSSVQPAPGGRHAISYYKEFFCPLTSPNPHLSPQSTTGASLRPVRICSFLRRTYAVLLRSLGAISVPFPWLPEGIWMVIFTSWWRALCTGLFTSAPSPSCCGHSLLHGMHLYHKLD